MKKITLALLLSLVCLNAKAGYIGMGGECTMKPGENPAICVNAIKNLIASKGCTDVTFTAASMNSHNTTINGKPVQKVQVVSPSSNICMANPDGNYGNCKPSTCQAFGAKCVDLRLTSPAPLSGGAEGDTYIVTNEPVCIKSQGSSAILPKATVIKSTTPVFKPKTSLGR